MSIFEWSTTAVSNATADANINWAEGQAPSTVNNSARAGMAAEASWLQGIGGALTTAGTGSAYTLTLADAPTAYTTSMLFLVKFHAVSASTTATINVNALGAKTLKLWDGSALPSASYIPINAYGLIKYDGTDMRVFLPSIAYTQGSTDVAVADGGTGASTAAAALTNLGAAPTASPSFSGIMTMATANWPTAQAEWGTFSTTGASNGQIIGGSGAIPTRRSSGNVTTNISHNQFYNPNGLVGSIVTNGTSTSFSTTSDGALKDAITDADKAAAIAKVKAGRPVEFEFKNEPGVKHLGFVAQEMHLVHPESVTPGDAETPWMMDHSKLVPVLWATVQDLLARVEALEAA